MSLIIVIGCIWGICKLISAASAASKERARQAEMARVRAAQERQRAEQARMREAWKAAQAAERERVRQMVALEKEQARQAKEQERLAKEQEKQAAILAKHEERLLRIEQKLELAKRDEEHWEQEEERLRCELVGEQAALNYCKNNPILRSKIESYEKKVDKLSKAHYNAETKLIKARQARELCEKQMAA